MHQLDSTAALCASVFTAVVAYTLNDVSLALLGIPITAVGMAAAGAVMSYAFGTSERSRKKLFFVAIASTIFGAAMVTLLPALFGWELKEEAQPPMAFVCALFSRWMVPAIKGALPAMANAAASIFNKGGGYGGYGGPYDMRPPYDDERDARPRDRRPPPNDDY